DPIGVELGEILGNLPLAVSVVERVVDRLRRYAKPRGLVAVDRHFDMRRVRQEIARDVGEFAERLQLVEQVLRPRDQFRDVGILQRVLETGARGPPAYGDILGGLEKQVRAFYLGN